MPHIPAKATVCDPFLLPCDNEGKPASVVIAVQHRRGRWILVRLAASRAACYARPESPRGARGLCPSCTS